MHRPSPARRYFRPVPSHYGDPLKVADEPGGKSGEFYAVYKVVRNGEELLINEIYLDSKAVAISYYWPGFSRRFYARRNRGVCGRKFAG
jgi:hypothetical protein